MLVNKHSKVYYIMKGGEGDYMRKRDYLIFSAAIVVAVYGISFLIIQLINLIIGG